MLGMWRIFGGDVSGKEMDPEWPLQYAKGFPSQVVLQQESKGHRYPGTSKAKSRGKRMQMTSNRSIFLGPLGSSVPPSSTASWVVRV